MIGGSTRTVKSTRSIDAVNEAIRDTSCVTSSLVVSSFVMQARELVRPPRRILAASAPPVGCRSPQPQAISSTTRLPVTTEPAVMSESLSTSAAPALSTNALSAVFFSRWSQRVRDRVLQHLRVLVFTLGDRAPSKALRFLGAALHIFLAQCSWRWQVSHPLWKFWSSQ